MLRNSSVHPNLEKQWICIFASRKDSSLHLPLAKWLHACWGSISRSVFKFTLSRHHDTKSCFLQAQEGCITSNGIRFLSEQQIWKSDNCTLGVGSLSSKNLNISGQRVWITMCLGVAVYGDNCKGQILLSKYLNCFIIDYLHKQPFPKWL